jgi:dynein heavy chain 2
MDEISECYFFFEGVKTNLHIVLIMDFTRPTFTVACQSNPGFFKECAVQWMEGWSERSMLKVTKKNTKSSLGYP